MCGLVGFFGPSAPMLRLRLSQAVESIRHRGPDTGGEYASPDGLCMLGHRRLSIVDLTVQGNQPLVRAGQALVYNGEIYNHQTLRSRLLPVETVYQSHSDTETLFYLLQRYLPSKVLTELEGMYAGAFYQEQEQSLLLFRDNMGIKPLYIKILPDSTLIFASEVRAILALLPESRPVVDPVRLAEYLTYENWPQGYSLFAGIQLLEPGTFLTARMSDDRVVIHSSRFEVGKELEPDVNSYQDLVHFCREVIDASVQQHLMSDVPLGAYLSGGIDSSIVTMLAVRYQADMMGFTGYFKTHEDYYDERPLSRLVAKHAQIPLHEVAITPEHFKLHFDAVIRSLEEPRMGMGTFSQYVVAEEAAKYRKVILAGHGGDELFGGYPLFKGFWLLQNFPGQQSWSVLAGLKAKEWPWIIDMGLSIARTGKLRFAPQLYPQAAKRLVLNSNVNVQTDFLRPLCKTPLQELNQYYLKTYLPGLLAVEDKISMAHSLETRLPLWSQKLYRQIINIPIADKLQHGQLKGLLKDVSKGILPDELLSAPKRGFPTPLRLWFRHELFDEVRERLLDRESPVHNLVPKHKLEELLHSHQYQKLPFSLDERRAHRIWMLLCLDSWARQFQVNIEAV